MTYDHDRAREYSAADPVELELEFFCVANFQPIKLQEMIIVIFSYEIHVYTCILDSKIT